MSDSAAVPQEVFEIARRQIEICISEIFRANANAHRNVRAQAAAHGTLASSRTVLEFDRVNGEAIAAIGAAVWSVLHRCLTMGRVGYSDDLAHQAKDFSKEFLSGTVRGLTTGANRERTTMGLLNPTMAPKESEECRLRAIAHLELEIDLFCMNLKRAPHETAYEPQAVINVHDSTVGSVQIGASASATVMLTTHTSAISEIQKAIGQLKAELAAAGVEDNTATFLLQETEKEAAGATPNKGRLSSFVSTIGRCFVGTIETAPKIADAIEAVQKTIDLLPG